MRSSNRQHKVQLQQSTLGKFSLEDRLQDILVRAREVATHGVRYGAGAALAVAQLRSGHELRHLEPGFPDIDRLEDQEYLIGDFTDVAEAITVIIHE